MSGTDMTTWRRMRARDRGAESIKHLMRNKLDKLAPRLSNQLYGIHEFGRLGKAARSRFPPQSGEWKVDKAVDAVFRIEGVISKAADICSAAEHGIKIRRQRPLGRRAEGPMSEMKWPRHPSPSDEIFLHIRRFRLNHGQGPQSFPRALGHLVDCPLSVNGCQQFRRPIRKDVVIQSPISLNLEPRAFHRVEAVRGLGQIFIEQPHAQILFAVHDRSIEGIHVESAVGKENSYRP